jgi:hypothetical protein
MYYQTKGGKSRGRQLVSIVKKRDKENAIRRKNERSRLYRATSIAKNFRKSPASVTTFKRPIIKRKK